MGETGGQGDLGPGGTYEPKVCCKGGDSVNTNVSASKTHTVPEERHTRSSHARNTCAYYGRCASGSALPNSELRRQAETRWTTGSACHIDGLPMLSESNAAQHRATVGGLRMSLHFLDFHAVTDARQAVGARTSRDSPKDDRYRKRTFASRPRMEPAEYREGCLALPMLSRLGRIGPVLGNGQRFSSTR